MSTNQTNELQTVDLQNDQLVKEKSAEGKRALAWAQSLEIQTQEQLDQATVARGDLLSAKKAIEHRRLFFVDGLNKQVTKFNQFFKTISIPFHQAETLVKNKIETFRYNQREAARKEQERLDRLAQKREERARAKAAAEEAAKLNAAPRNEPQPTPPPPPPPRAQVPDLPKQVAGGSFRKEWTFQIRDVASIPKEYWVLDETLIRKAIRSGVRTIPGLRIYEKETLVNR